MSSTAEVSSVAELIAAAEDPSVEWIAVQGQIAAAPTFRLAPGQSLRGVGNMVAIAFANGVDGVRLSSDNQVHDITLRARRRGVRLYARYACTPVALGGAVRLAAHASS
jgi:hypothetical protein